MDEIENQIWRAFEEVRDEYRILLGGKTGSNIGITKRIKEKVQLIGEKRDYEIRSSNYTQEWMFDLVWYRKNAVGDFERLILALESEISSRDKHGLLKDFEKLLVSNADYRVMIALGKGSKRSSYPQIVNEQIEIFNQAFNATQSIPIGARVLILIWDDYDSDKIIPHLLIKK